MKRSIAISGVVLLLAAAGWLAFGPSRGSVLPSSEKGDARALPTKQAQAETKRGEREAQKLLNVMEQVKAEGEARWSADRVAEEVRAAKDTGEKRRLLGQLRDGRYERTGALRVLRAALREPDVAVRVLAAELLFLWGSPDGKATLLEILESVPSLPAAELIHAVRAAEVLDLNGEMIPFESLTGLYRETDFPGVLRVMAAQGDERYLAFLMERAKQDPNGTVGLVGDLGSKEGYDFARRVFERTTNAVVKVNAAWAMYRCGQDQSALQFLAAQAQQELNRSPGADRNAGQAALRYLAVIPDEASRMILRTAVQSPTGTLSSPALASLFYVQKDTEFVDRFLHEYLTHPTVQANYFESADAKAKWSLDPNLVWRIVGDRDDPTLTALALAANAERSKQVLGSTKGFPAQDAWLSGYLGKKPEKRSGIDAP